MTMSEGSPAPDFTLAASGGRTVSLGGQLGRPFLLYFYPRASTPGCTREACAFEEALPRLQGLGLDIIGVSPDAMPAIERFAAKYHLTFPLASDPDHATASAYAVWNKKSLYGRLFMGIERSSFLIDEAGRIARIWRKVKVAGHAGEVLAAAQSLTKAR